MLNKRAVWAGLSAGVIGHIMQGAAAYFFFDRFYLANADLVRDANWATGFYYLFLNMIVGTVIAHVSQYLQATRPEPDWKAGIKAGLLIWAASSPIWVIRRQIILKLPNWLILEIPVDLVIYTVMGALAGFLVGRGIIEKERISR